MFAVIVSSYSKSTFGGDGQTDNDFFGVFLTKERAEDVAAVENAKGNAQVRHEERLEVKGKLHSDYQLLSVTATVSELKPDGNGGFLAK